MILETFVPTIYKNGLGRVTSPPFDMITKATEKELKKNPYNIVNLKDCKDPEEARKLFNKWLEEGVLSKNNSQGFVVLKQVFTEGGVQRERYGVIGIINLLEPENCLIPHESIITKLVNQREKLIERMEYQTEPVFVVSEQTNLNSTLKSIMSEQECERVYEEPEGVFNSICILSDPVKIGKIQEVLKGDIGIIADGHHRTKAMLSLSKKYGEDVQFFNHLFVFVTSLRSESIFIAQVHRIVDYNEDIMKRIRENFIPEKTGKSLDLKYPVIIHGESKYLLKPKTEMKYGDYLDAIDNSIKRGSSRAGIKYTYISEEAENDIRNDPNKMAFMMPPWDKEGFVQTLKRGYVLPAKSTYFYPKIPSGIAFYGLDAQECRCGLVGRAADS